MSRYIYDKGRLIHRESVQLGESSGCFIHINVYSLPCTYSLKRLVVCCRVKSWTCVNVGPGMSDRDQQRCDRPVGLTASWCSSGLLPYLSGRVTLHCLLQRLLSVQSICSSEADSCSGEIL